MITIMTTMTTMTTMTMTIMTAIMSPNHSSASLISGGIAARKRSLDRGASRTKNASLTGSSRTLGVIAGVIKASSKLRSRMTTSVSVASIHGLNTSIGLTTCTFDETSKLLITFNNTKEHESDCLKAYQNSRRIYIGLTTLFT